jgi:RNA polymerase primary sigma factor
MQHLRDLRQYFTDIASIPRLSQEEIRQLTSSLAAARQGTISPDVATQARQRLIEGHLWLPVTLVRRSGARVRSLSPLDLVQQGNLGLLRTLDRFDYASGGNFTAYASTTIYYAILDALPMENTIRVSYDLTWRNCTDEHVEELRALQPLSLDALHGQAEDCTFAETLEAPPLMLPDPAAAAAAEQRQQARRAQVEALLSRLTEREQQVLRLRYGLDEADGRCLTPAAIARQLGLDCSTVSHLEYRALRKLRALPRLQDETAAKQQANRRQEQLERLQAACVDLEQQGLAITVKALARQSHVDKAAVRPFVRDYWNQHGSEQERLEAACAALEAEGLPITMANLCSRAHVGSRAAAAFLRNYHPVDRPRPVSKPNHARPAKASPQERLSEAYAHLLERGEKVTKARLRKEARVGTNAAGAFLRARRSAQA